MFEILKGLFQKGKLTEVELEKAVKKTWITEEEKILIMNCGNNDIVK